MLGLPYNNMDVKAASSPANLLELQSSKMHNVLSTKVLTKPIIEHTSITSSSPSVDKTDNHDTSLLNTMNLEREEERLKTFDKWPVTFLPPRVLAKNGFYYLGRGDEVRCAFCKVEIMRWLQGDDPAEEHKRWAPQCPLLRRNMNIGMVGHDECGTRAPSTSTQRMSAGPVYPNYASESARLATFKDWPRCMRQKPEEMAEAGFYYTGKGDKTKCFYCDGGLKDWEPEDIPWEQHARWFNRCAYVHLVKGRDYVEKVRAEAEASAQSASVELKTNTEEQKTTAATPSVSEDSTTASSDENHLTDEKLCKICYVSERNVGFVPCGHVVACAKCALSTDKCPMCRRTFNDVIRLYFS